MRRLPGPFPMLTPLTQVTPIDPTLFIRPNLIPVGIPGQTSDLRYCRRDGRNLFVEIRNVGLGPAGPSTTRVVYENGQAVDRMTPALGRFQSATLTFPDPFTIPHRFADVSFQIIADVLGQVAETNELDNTVRAFCLG